MKRTNYSKYYPMVAPWDSMVARIESALRRLADSEPEISATFVAGDYRLELPSFRWHHRRREEVEIVGYSADEWRTETIGTSRTGAYRWVEVRPSDVPSEIYETCMRQVEETKRALMPAHKKECARRGAELLAQAEGVWRAAITSIDREVDREVVEREGRLLEELAALIAEIEADVGKQ